MSVESQQRQHIGDAQAVVRSERGSFGADETAVELQPHAAIGEIMRVAFIDLAHHVEVAVQDRLPAHSRIPACPVSLR